MLNRRRRRTVGRTEALHLGRPLRSLAPLHQLFGSALLGVGGVWLVRAALVAPETISATGRGRIAEWPPAAVVAGAVCTLGALAFLVLVLRDWSAVPTLFARVGDRGVRVGTVSDVALRRMVLLPDAPVRVVVASGRGPGRSVPPVSRWRLQCGDVQVPLVTRYAPDESDVAAVHAWVDHLRERAGTPTAPHPRG